MQAGSLQLAWPHDCPADLRELSKRCTAQPAGARPGFADIVGELTRMEAAVGLGFGVQGSGFRVQGSGFTVQGSGFRVQGSGFTVQGSGFRVQDSGFQGSGFTVCQRCVVGALWTARVHDGYGQ